VKRTGTSPRADFLILCSALGIALLALASCRRASEVSGDAAVRPPGSAQGGRLRVEVTGFRNAKGMARALLFVSDDGFPGGVDKAFRRAESQIQEGKATLEFTDVPPGAYAVSVIHDANANGRLDTNIVGIPQEGFGVSGKRAGVLGPPRFEDARFDFQFPEQTMQVTLR